MRILFINPGMARGRSRDAMEPLAFAVLAALTGSEHQIDFIGNRIEPLPDLQPAVLQRGVPQAGP